MQDQNELRFTLFPVIPWFAGTLSLGMAIIIFTREGLSTGTIVMGALGLLGIFLPGMLFITANRTERILLIERMSLTMIGSSKKIGFDEIADLRLAKAQARGRPRSSKRKRLYAYRMEVVRKDGGIIPFRAAFSSGDGEKQRDMTQQLSAFIGCAAEIPSLSPYEE